MFQDDNAVQLIYEHYKPQITNFNINNVAPYIANSDSALQLIIYTFQEMQSNFVHFKTQTTKSSFNTDSSCTSPLQKYMLLPEATPPPLRSPQFHLTYPKPSRRMQSFYICAVNFLEALDFKTEVEANKQSWRQLKNMSEGEDCHTFQTVDDNGTNFPDAQKPIQVLIQFNIKVKY